MDATQGEEAVKEDEEDRDKSSSPGPNHGKGKKAQGKKKERGRRNREICDVFGEAAMINAYYICHNIQDFLYCRGFPWQGQKK